MLIGNKRHYARLYPCMYREVPNLSFLDKILFIFLSVPNLYTTYTVIILRPGLDTYGTYRSFVLIVLIAVLIVLIEVVILVFYR